MSSSPRPPWRGRTSSIFRASTTRSPPRAPTAPAHFGAIAVGFGRCFDVLEIPVAVAFEQRNGPDRALADLRQDVALLLIARARELRLKVIISSCFESDLGLNQLFHLAGEWAPEQAPGLDTRRWMAGNLLGDDGKPDLSRLEKLYYRD